MAVRLVALKHTPCQCFDYGHRLVYSGMSVYRKERDICCLSD